MQTDAEVNQLNLKNNIEEIKPIMQEILFKSTPDQFKFVISKIKLNIDTEKKVRELADLIFEKAINEPNFANIYAKLSSHLNVELKLMNQQSKVQHHIFRNIILDKVEGEFRNVINEASKKKLFLIRDKLINCDANKKLELQEELIKEANKIHKRSCGIVLFVGELFNSSCLTTNIIRSCINALLNETSENKLEYLCIILKTVGKTYESTPNIRLPKKNKFFSLETVIKDMQQILNTKKHILSNRVTSLMKDVIKLKNNNWQTL